MLVLSVRFLAGDFVAAAPGGAPEWPPHPARLLYALIAAFVDGGSRPAELGVLRWLERQPPPAIDAPARVPSESYHAWLPMNVLPKARNGSPVRHESAGRSSFVGDRSVRFCWPVDLPPEHERSLRDLARRTTRLGAAQSLVALTVSSTLALNGVAWRPSAVGTLLRIPIVGVADAVIRLSTALPGRVLPCDWVPYSCASLRGEATMLAVALIEGQCSIEGAPDLARDCRRALLGVAAADGEPRSSRA